jgi:hypothetical protein
VNGEGEMVKEAKVENDERRHVECGLIMPISQTAQHSEQHWADVQLLLHRGIEKAGMKPINVWAGDLKDRVSERIVGNIFRHDVVVADISDLNPNVMLELGLRLASKKPTIVVVELGGVIPFDIRDFHAIQYPSDLNILGMENFFDVFAKTLKSKLDGYVSGNYKPFLGEVVVEVLEPSTKNVSIDNIVVERLDEIGRRLSVIERGMGANLSNSESINWMRRERGGSQIYVKGPHDHLEELIRMLRPIVSELSVVTSSEFSFIALSLGSNTGATGIIRIAEAYGFERVTREEGRSVFKVSL